MNHILPESQLRLRIYATIPLVLSIIFVVHYTRAYLAEQSNYAVDFQLYYGAAQSFALEQWSRIYDTAAIQNYINGSVKNFHPFINPPWALILLYPLQLFPHNYALILWYIIGLVTLCFAINSVRKQYFTPSLIILLLLAAPHFVIGFASAQTGWLLSGLCILALVHHKTMPIFAGLALAIAGAIKPHLVIVFFPLFLGLWQWRILVSAALWGAGILSISVAVLPIDIWGHYLTHISLASEVLKATDYDYGRISILAIKIWGVSHASAMLIHICIVPIILAVIFYQARKFGANLRVYSITAVGAFLVSPYGYMYDMPLLLLPLLYWWQMAQSRPLNEVERLSFILLSTMPVILTSVQTLSIPMGPITLILSFIALIQARPQPPNTVKR